MKVNILDAHDRLLHFKKQSDYISNGCQECIRKRPQEFGNNNFYIFAHARTSDDGVSKRLLWQPRLAKPRAQSNSMLFKYYPASDTIKIIWMIPARELWEQYRKGNLTEHKIIVESLHDFLHNKAKLEEKEPDDLPDFKIDDIYRMISLNAQAKQAISVASQASDSTL